MPDQGCWNACGCMLIGCMRDARHVMPIPMILSVGSHFNTIDIFLAGGREHVPGAPLTDAVTP